MGTYQWQQRDGDWGFYNDDNILYSGQNEFIIQLSSALKGIMNGGNVGYELVRDLANHANIMTIMQSDRSGADRNNQVGWNPTGIRRDGTSESVPTADGLRNDPLITLGHELSHVVYNWSGKNAHTCLICPWQAKMVIQNNGLFLLLRFLRPIWKFIAKGE